MNAWFDPGAMVSTTPLTSMLCFAGIDWSEAFELDSEERERKLEEDNMGCLRVGKRYLLDVLSDVELLLMLLLMERSSGYSCMEDWSDSTELVLGG